MQRVKETSKKDIEAKLLTLGDYVKIEYLSNCLQQNLDFDARKFVLLQLAKLYESKSMPAEAGRMMRAAADINTTFQGKIIDFIKSAELFTKADNFEEADSSVNKALASANMNQKEGIKTQQKIMYMNQAKILLQKDKRKHALTAFEKLASLNLTPIEKIDVQNNLLQLYEKLGMVREFYNIKRSM